jgi:hypothetical protein
MECDMQNRRNKNFILLCCAVLAFITGVVSACKIGSNREPPFAFGTSEPGAKIRETSLIKVNQAEGHATYAIDYPGLGLKSWAIANLYSGALLAEIFEGRWQVEYSYSNDFNRISRIPSEFTVFDISGGKPEIVNIYSNPRPILLDIAKDFLGSQTNPNVLSMSTPFDYVRLVVYFDRQKHEKQINPTYFRVSNGPYGRIDFNARK